MGKGGVETLDNIVIVGRSQIVAYAVPGNNDITVDLPGSDF